ncbi:hypothetical protein BDBG_17180 [Blastomyces gilchristii SLH14081]|uniref:Uncharacterized protein n=1 Tax=Blastomyces gilchristii (strain SLH14081) TaxID=559298 RepID=A0A179UQC4_BLAGS|nr:uncharacterized protein BDBG_17180 [Blastomyces gilchristii SLH14081]OAT09231.1 hypothetical protein BDBG_17180 [Blastomyces gilchristii SLH14081]
MAPSSSSLPPRQREAGWLIINDPAYLEMEPFDVWTVRLFASTPMSSWVRLDASLEGNDNILPTLRSTRGHHSQGLLTSEHRL